jgi:hypothetical protein
LVTPTTTTTTHKEYKMSTKNLLTAQILTIIHNHVYNRETTYGITYELKKIGIVKSQATIRRHCKILQSLKIVEPTAFGSTVKWSTCPILRTEHAPPRGNITVEQAVNHINKINQLKQDVVNWRRIHG